MRVLFSILLFVASSTLWAQDEVKCLIQTELGEIEIVLYATKAPVTVNNFLRYVDNDMYVNSSFFRVCTPENEATREIKIEVIQGGNLVDQSKFDPIDIETTNVTGIMHTSGTLSMARSAANTATSQFFICIGDQPELNYQGKRHPDGYGFAAFGKVVKGMDVVKAIQGGENKKQRLINPVRIISISRMSK